MWLFVLFSGFSKGGKYELQQPDIFPKIFLSHCILNSCKFFYSLCRHYYFCTISEMQRSVSEQVIAKMSLIDNCKKDYF